MFSENGYSATNIRELSASLGLGKSSLYRHYESKEEIWNSMIDEMERYYNTKFGSSENLPEIPESTAAFKSLVMNMLNFTLHDEKIKMTRKILLTEQFRDERIKSLATKHFNSGLEDMFTSVFTGMIKNGSLKKDDPQMLSFIFTSPVSSLVLLCDRQPEKESEILEKSEAFIDRFISQYGC